MPYSRILVVDNDKYIRELMQTILKDADIQVASAEDGPHALQMLEREPIELAIVEVCLPGALDGLETIRRARVTHPALKTLFISGKIDGPVGTDRAKDEFVRKPFRNCEFLGCVFELLNRRSR